MASYQEPIGAHTLPWPYPVNYGKENQVSADVLRPFTDNPQPQAIRRHVLRVETTPIVSDAQLDPLLTGPLALGIRLG